MLQTHITYTHLWTDFEAIVKIRYNKNPIGHFAILRVELRIVPLL